MCCRPGGNSTEGLCTFVFVLYLSVANTKTSQRIQFTPVIFPIILALYILFSFCFTAKLLIWFKDAISQKVMHNGR